MQAKQIILSKINFLDVVNALALRHQSSLSRENLQGQRFSGLLAPKGAGSGRLAGGILSVLQHHLKERRGGVQARAGVQPVPQQPDPFLDAGIQSAQFQGDRALHRPARPAEGW